MPNNAASKWSQLKIAAELLKSLGIDPTHCTHAEIIVDYSDPIKVRAEFEVMPLQIAFEDGVGKIKTMMKEFTLVEESDE